jgi:hypothetical protein
MSSIRQTCRSKLFLFLRASLWATSTDRHAGYINFSDAGRQVVQFRDVSQVLHLLDPVANPDCLLTMGFAYWKSRFTEDSPELKDFNNAKFRNIAKRQRDWELGTQRVFNEILKSVNLLPPAIATNLQSER